MADAIDVDVEWLGADGDGVAHTPDGKPLFLPLTLPGERVSAELRAGPRAGRHAIATAILRASPDRVAPPCIHFGQCGGCALQHADDATYAAWKTDLLRRALVRAGYPDPPVAALRRSPPGSRRRVDLALRRTTGGIAVGLHERHTGHIVDLHECHVLTPRLVDLIGGLRGMLPRLHGFRRSGDAIVNLLDSGPDLLLRTDAALGAADRRLLPAFAVAHGISRISHALGGAEPETACMYRPASTGLSGVEVTLPPGAFQQATPQGEAAIIAAVLDALPTKLPAKAVIAELFAGVGTLTFPLAARARVLAWERDGAALAALRAAAHAHGLAGRIAAEARDLARQPLQPAELLRVAAVVLDPPWAGAAEQVGLLAAPLVVYVSCNPHSLSRDAEVLRRNGYRVAAAVPVDQFLWSSRLESVVSFARDRRSG